MSGNGMGNAKFEKDTEDLDVAMLPEPNADEKKCEYGGFTDEAYDELVRYHRDKEIPKRLHGHMKHRIDCFKRKAKRFQLIEGTDQLIYVGFKPDHSTVGQFVVKKGDVEKILNQAHLESNHGGLNATRKMVSTKFYWNSITNDVEQFIKQCPRCRVTRMRYIASNNVPWRKASRYGDIYGEYGYTANFQGSWDEIDDDYGSDRPYNRTWKIARGSSGDEYITYAPSDVDLSLLSSWKCIKPVGDIIIGDEISNDDIDVENDIEEPVATESKIDTQMFLPQYFRVKSSQPLSTRSRPAEWLEREPILDYDESSYGNADEAYYEDEYISGEAINNVAPSVEEKLVVEDRLDNNTDRSRLAKTAMCKEKTVESSSVRKRYVDDGREYVIETDKKYFMVEAEQILQLFKRCPECGEKLKKITLYADSPMPVVAYQCRKCEPAVWFGQKWD